MENGPNHGTDEGDGHELELTQRDMHELRTHNQICLF